MIRQVNDAGRDPGTSADTASGTARTAADDADGAPDAAPAPPANPPRRLRAVHDPAPAAAAEADRPRSPTVHPWDRLKIAAEAPVHGPRSRLRLITSRPYDPAAKAIDQLRTRVLRAMKANNWTRLAITSPTDGCGASFTAVNLALSLSRLDTTRTLLMDLDLRAPGLARAFGIRHAGALPDLLTGQRKAQQHLFRIGENLALGLNDCTVPDAGTILQHPDTWDMLDDLHGTLDPDITLYDLAPMLGRDEVEAFLPVVDCVLLVADGTRTTGRQITECERLLQGQAPLLGVILNRGEIRKAPKPRQR